MVIMEADSESSIASGSVVTAALLSDTPKPESLRLVTS